VFDLLLWTSSVNDKCLKENAENIFIPSGVKISNKRGTFRNYNYKIYSSFSTLDVVKLVLQRDVEDLKLDRRAKMCRVLVRETSFTAPID
jgi:hypothetical protein